MDSFKQYAISCDTCGAKCRYKSHTDREAWVMKHTRRYPGHVVRLIPKTDTPIVDINQCG